MKKIFIFIDQLHSHGGIEKLVAEKANYWVDVFGYEVKIISTEQENKPFVYSLSQEVVFQDLGIDYQRGLSFFHPQNLRRLVKNFVMVKKLVSEEQPDYILVASHLPMTYLLPFIKKGARLIKEFHFSKYQQRLSFKERFFGYIERKYDQLVVLSDEEAGFYPSSNTVVIPNPVRIPDFENKKWSDRPDVAVAALRFAPVKQLEKMVGIWEQFSLRYPGWRLHIYGEKAGSYYEDIHALVCEKKLEHVIEFKGKTDDIFTVFQESKLLLMTSENECFPMVILEAYANGVPVVSYDSPTGPRNMITHGVDGFLIPYGQDAAFVQQLADIAENAERMQEMSEAARQKAKEYELQKVMNLWKSLIFENS